YEMSRELPESNRALPVLKVLYRNATHIQAKGGRKNEALHPVSETALPERQSSGEAIREACRKNERAAAEGMVATLAKGPAAAASDQLQDTVHDDVNVHRTVLAWRAWTMLDFTGPEHAHTLLRQSVLFCCRERARQDRLVQNTLTKLLDQHKLMGKKPGTRA